MAPELLHFLIMHEAGAYEVDVQTAARNVSFAILLVRNEWPRVMRSQYRKRYTTSVQHFSLWCMMGVGRHQQDLQLHSSTICL